jgi:transcriptional regulator with XRE-family HTH domain
MSKRTPTVLSSAERLLKELGENLRLARLRRGFSAQIVSERADISLPTLRSIERGKGNVSISAYVNLLFVLGLQEEIGVIARTDPLGRKIQDSELTVRKRAPRTRSS